MEFGLPTNRLSNMKDDGNNVHHKERNVASVKPAGQSEKTAPVSLRKSPASPFSFNIQVDVMHCVILVISLATRMWRLDYPRGTVFDEVHFGKTAAMYIQQTFHFDIVPPLGKMLIALGGYYAGFNGNFNAVKVGTEMGPEIPVWNMRFFPAFLGGLVAPIVYQIVRDLGLSSWTAVIASLLIILDNALLVQSRFMFVEGMLLFFISLSVLAYLKLRQAEERADFSPMWWFAAVTMVTAGTLGFCVRYLGGFTLFLVLFLSTRDFWKLLPDPRMTNARLVRHIAARLAVFIAIPVALYLSVFYVHLSILKKAGPHDSVLTSAFQASLEGGLAAITKGQPLEVVYGSQITLRHTYGKPCWLHSHNALYPIKYPDKRGSSHQQQVTCYRFKDVNNWWIIKDPHNDSMGLSDPRRPVRNGDVIQLIHGMTSRSLNSHDVAAAMSPKHQEVSGYIDHNISAPPQNLWRLEIVNKDGPDDHWKTIQSTIRLHHVNSSQVIKITGSLLPDWGFNQMEVATDRETNGEASLWNVEEHRYLKDDDQEKGKRDLAAAEMIPMAPTRMSFLGKFYELQMKMFFSERDVSLEHKYSSNPLEWPLLDTNIAYWVKSDDYAQIHLIGNPVVWYSGALCTLAYLTILTFYVLRRRRGYQDISPELWGRFVDAGELLAVGYLLHFVPYLLLDRTLFLYLYLPALVYQVILTAAVIEHLYRLIRTSLLRVFYVVAISCWLVVVAYTFVSLLPLTYGCMPMTEEHLDRLTWRDTWTFLKKHT